MGFWGMSQSGKDSQAAIPAYASWSKSKSDESADRSNESRAQGNQRSSEAWDLYKQRASEGIGNTGQIREQGQAIMPGVEEAIAQRNALLAGKNENWTNFQYKTPELMNKVNSTLDTMGGNVGTTVDFNQDIINKGAAELDAVAGGANAEIVKNIKDSYAAGKLSFNDAYNAMRQAAKGVYSGLESELNTSTAAQQKNLETLRPGSEASMASAARSYAPMMTNTMSRLRRGGVDPNSVQAGGMLAQAESQRARGIDDAAAAGAEKYATLSNSVLADKQAGLERLRGAGLAADTTLGTTQAGTNLDLGLSEAEKANTEAIRNAGVRSGIIGDKKTEDLANSTFGFNAGQSVLDKRLDAAAQERTAGLQDLDIQQALADQGMTEAMVGPEALAAQFAAGQGYATAQTNAQNTGIAGMSQIAQADLARSIQESMLAQGFSQEAIDAQLKNLGIESANAGWGLKAILSGAQQAASAYAGGA